MRLDTRTGQLCMAGTHAEFERRIEDARCLFREAWNAATDHYDTAVAAHYMGHIESDPLAALVWHLRALEAAYRDDRTQEFRASLHVALGGCYEALGMPEAKQHFEIATRLGIVHVPKFTTPSYNVTLTMSSV
jgi:hypothetical protein